MLRLAFDFIITWRETRTRPNAYIKRTKRTGALFRYILDKENLKPCQLVHIGDTLKSDFIRPKIMGIHTTMITLTIFKCKIWM